MNFVPEVTKYLFFKIEILDFNIDEQRSDVSQHVKVFIDFGSNNFNAVIRKLKYKEMKAKQNNTGG